VSRFRISIDSDLSEVFVIPVLLRGLCNHLGMDEDKASSLELCAVEAVTNAIKHAYTGASGHEVVLDVSFTRERLDLNVRDKGMSMPADQRTKLSHGSKAFEFDPADLEAVPEGGMGLEIIRQEMDEVSYSADDGGNCFRLTRFLGSVDSNGGNL
jgi:serine/threonine-protein kinase RsbW